MFLVLRPQAKADASCEALKNAGFESFALPAVHINILSTQFNRPRRISAQRNSQQRNSQQQTSLKASIDELANTHANTPINTQLNTHKYDVIIVTSTYTEAFLQQRLANIANEKTHFLCVGKTSAAMISKCLQKINLTAKTSVAQPENSEGILAILTAINVTHKSCALVKGKGGRKLIEDYLAQKSDYTDIFEVYERVTSLRPQDINDVERLPIKCIIVTSVDIAEQLLTHFSALWLKARIFMVASQRIYDYLLAEGMTHIVLADGASSSAIVACAKHLHQSGVLDDKGE
ncbi:uroporphyrinogen-III synthase [Glaciecola siphonariae]|uniref:Uroporphyrinogen-III synthase n=1 Tax=Glaciecola siphonariae TaxID=521012 RepID=A0ABV9LY35_9ALTE